MNKKRKKYSIPDTIGNLIISQIIGHKPRRPRSYAMRMKRKTDADIEFCKQIDQKIEDWEKAAEEIRKKSAKEREVERLAAKNFPVKEEPALIATDKHILADFIGNYKHLNKGKNFNRENPYSKTEEPIIFLYTLIFYFTKDERFFRSPLLRKDLSEPSFDKGTLTIGNYGCGKSSIFKTLLYTFKNHVKYARETRPPNLEDIIRKYDLNSCVSSDIVNRYNIAKSKDAVEELLKPLMSSKPLYIDDITREQNGSNFGIRNIFLDVLTHRADDYAPTHLSMNYGEKKDDAGKVIGFKNTEESLLLYRTRYDGRVHDRLFGQYNIIEMTGKSFRR